MAPINLRVLRVWRCQVGLSRAVCDLGVRSRWSRAKLGSLAARRSELCAQPRRAAAAAAAALEPPENTCQTGKPVAPLGAPPKLYVFLRSFMCAQKHFASAPNKHKNLRLIGHNDETLLRNRRSPRGDTRLTAAIFEMAAERQTGFDLAPAKTIAHLFRSFGLQANFCA